MIKPNKTILSETLYILLWTAILSVIMQVAFIALNHWDYTVLLGNLWGGSISVLNFFCMGLFIQKAVSVNQDEARKIIKLSQTLRTLALFVLIVIGILVPFFSTIAVILPLFFSRVGIFIKAFQIKKKEAEHQNET